MEPGAIGHCDVMPHVVLPSLAATAGVCGRSGSGTTNAASVFGGSSSVSGTEALGGAAQRFGGQSASAVGQTSNGGSVVVESNWGAVATDATIRVASVISSACGSGTSTASDVVVDLRSVQQETSGFGASTAWSATGAGLPLHRIRIDTTGAGTSETDIAKLAVARGATVWAMPWTPPPADKDNSNEVTGHPSNGQDFAGKLATFETNMSLWIMGNYSRFVRLGYQRVGTSSKIPSNVLLSANKDPTDGTVVVVASNSGPAAADLSVFITGAAPCTLTPHVTSSLTAKSSVTVSGSLFTFSLGARSVTTVVGKP